MVSNHFYRYLNGFTAIGAVPVFACLFASSFKTLDVQFLILIYISIIFSFISGIEWLVGVKTQKINIVLCAIVTSLAPLLPIFFLLTGILIARSVLIIDLIWLWLILLLDINIYRKTNYQDVLGFRKVGTLCLSLAILTNLFITHFK